MAGRIVVVGGVAAGASAAAKARRTNEEVEIVLVEGGKYVSFANCGLPYYVGGEIPRRDDLFVARPEMFRRRFRIDVRLQTVAASIDPGGRTVQLQPAEGAPQTLSYDRLVLATGTTPIVPPIDGLAGCPRVFTCRTVPDVDAIVARIDELIPKEAEAAKPSAVKALQLRALIIGGGYIGLECAEQLLRRGINVTVVELMGQLMGPLDPEMAQPIQAALEGLGVEVILGDGVAGLEQCELGRTKAVLTSGREVAFDLAVLGVGVRPNVALAREAGIEIGPTGATAVDESQRTSDPAIYAAGDNCQAVFLPTGKPVNIPLAGPANRQGRVAGANAALDLLGASEDDRRRLRFPGVLGTSVVRVCGTVAGGTGLTEKTARSQGIDAAVAYLPGPDHAGYYPGAREMLVKLVYDPADGTMLGAQVVGGNGVDKRIDVLATAIFARMTVEDLEGLDLAYAPPFGSARDTAVLAGFVAANARRGTAPAISPAKLLEELDGSDPPLVIDVRTAKEHAAGHFDSAVNIPIDDLRDRLDEVPQDRPVVLHCEVGYRSYIAQQILRNRGYDNVRNLQGGFALLGRAAKLKADREARGQSKTQGS